MTRASDFQLSQFANPSCHPMLMFGATRFPSLGGAQLRFSDINGHRFTAFATDAKTGQLADLELRHRRRARCEDRIRCAKDTGLRNLPLHSFGQNQLWCELVAMAGELTAWMQ